MNYYKISSANFADIHEGDFELLEVKDGKIIVQTSGTLPKPFTKISKLDEALSAQIAERFENAKNAKIAELNKACDEELLSFKSSALGEEYTYDLATEDQINYMGLAMANTDAFMRCYKVDENGEIIGYKQNLPHTATQIQQAYADGAAHKIAQIAKCGTLKEQVEKAQTIAEINAVKWKDETADETAQV